MRLSYLFAILGHGAVLFVTSYPTRHSSPTPSLPGPRILPPTENETSRLWDITAAFREAVQLGILRENYTSASEIHVSPSLPTRPDEHDEPYSLSMRASKVNMESQNMSLGGTVGSGLSLLAKPVSRAFVEISKRIPKNGNFSDPYSLSLKPTSGALVPSSTALNISLSSLISRRVSFVTRPVSTAFVELRKRIPKGEESNGPYSLSPKPAAVTPVENHTVGSGIWDKGYSNGLSLLVGPMSKAFKELSKRIPKGEGGTYSLSLKPNLASPPSSQDANIKAANQDANVNMTKSPEKQALDLDPESLQTVLHEEREALEIDGQPPVSQAAGNRTARIGDSNERKDEISGDQAIGQANSSSNADNVVFRAESDLSRGGATPRGSDIDRRDDGIAEPTKTDDKDSSVSTNVNAIDTSPVLDTNGSDTDTFSDATVETCTSTVEERDGGSTGQHAPNSTGGDLIPTEGTELSDEDDIGVSLATGDGVVEMTTCNNSDSANTIVPGANPLDTNTKESDNKTGSSGLLVVESCHANETKRIMDNTRSVPDFEGYSPEAGTPFEASMMDYSVSIPESWRQSDDDFKRPVSIKAYAVEQFSQLRSMFGITEAAFKNSLVDSGAFVSFQSNSKGAARIGGVFFFSPDGAFLIKTIKKDEVPTLLNMLPKYCSFMRENGRRTLLTRFCGMYDVCFGDERQTLVIMNSVFPAASSEKIRERFDLKGSTIGRESSPEERATKGINAVLKDLDLANEMDGEEGSDAGLFNVGASRKASLLEQLRRDIALLVECSVIDYSLLVGVEPLVEVASVPGAADAQGGKAVSFDVDGGELAAIKGTRKGKPAMFYLGLIDFLQPFNMKKVIEYRIKSLMHEKESFSCVPPDVYANRLLTFLDKHIV